MAHRKPLTAQQEIFVAEYLKSRNACDAAIKAGYSKKTARTLGPRVLRNVAVADAVARGLAQVTRKAVVTAADVLNQIRKHAFAEIREAYSKDGQLLPLHEMPEDVRAIIQGVKSEELFAGKGAKRFKVGHAVEVKKSDSLRALEMLAKHFKLLTDVSETLNLDEPTVVLTMPANGSEAPERRKANS